jgi:hypothetical protein
MSDEAFAHLREALEDALAFERGVRRDFHVTRIQAPRPPKYDKVCPAVPVLGGDKKIVEALSTIELIETVEEQQSTTIDLLEIDVNKLPSPVLARLIEEVRNEESSVPDAYSRFHNRHNRSR